MKTDKIIEILKKIAGLAHYREAIDFEYYAKEIDSLYPTLNRDRVMEIKEEIKKAADQYEKLQNETFIGEYINEDFVAGAKWAINQLTKPKEEER